MTKQVSPRRQSHQPEPRMEPRFQLSPESTAARLTGRIEAFSVNEDLNRVLRIDTYRQVKEGESYRSLDLTWEGYCTDILGRPRSSVDEEINWLNSLGADTLRLALESGFNRQALRLLHAGQSAEETRVVVEAGEIVIGDKRAPIENATAAADLIAQHLSWLQNQVEDARVIAAEKDDQLKKQAAAHAAELAERDAAIDQLGQRLNTKKAQGNERKRLFAIEGAFLTDLADFARQYSILLKRARAEVPNRDEVKPWLSNIAQTQQEFVEWAYRRHRYALGPGMDPDVADELDRALAKQQEEEFDAAVNADDEDPS